MPAGPATALSREVSASATYSETLPASPTSKPRESEMLREYEHLSRKLSANRSDAIAGALLLGITLQVFTGPLGGVLGAIAGAAAGTAVFPRIFPHPQNGSKRPVE